MNITENFLIWKFFRFKNYNTYKFLSLIIRIVQVFDDSLLYFIDDFIAVLK
jgi:hypothetical protein